MTAIVLALIVLHLTDEALASRVPLEILELSQSAGPYKSSSDDFLAEHGVHDHKDAQKQGPTTGMALQHDTRIFYQVGTSEDDLPICAPNEVCSKIDLYEKPWIERQCRCPDKHIIRESYQSTLHKIPLINQNNEIFRGRKFKHPPSKHSPDLGENVHLKLLLQRLEAAYKGEEDGGYHFNDRQNVPGSGDLLMTNDDEPKHNHDSIRLRHNAHHKATPHISGCPTNTGGGDGHTIVDKTRHYKLCNPVHKLPICRYFRDYTWTLSILSDLNVTEQIVHCRCPQNSVTYLTKREPLKSGKAGYVYLFACSPQSRLRCQRKEPCTLFTVRKRQEFLDEVNTNPLCLCPKGHHCPRHHTDPGVISGKNYIEDNIHTYSGYCMTNG